MMDLSFQARNYRYVRAAPALMYWKVVSKIPQGPLPMTSMDVQVSSAAFQNEARNVMETCLSGADTSSHQKQIDSSVALQVEVLLLNAPTLSSLRELLNRVIQSGRTNVSSFSTLSPSPPPLSLSVSFSLTHKCTHARANTYLFVSRFA